MSFKKQENQMIEVCTRLLTEGEVDVVIGFSSDQLGGCAIPSFIRKPLDVKDLKWDDTCTPNLAKYVIERLEKVAIIAKPCDARALVMYQIENQIDRNHVYIIGMECPGMKLSDGTPAPGCQECTVRTPPIFDILIEADKIQTFEVSELSSNRENSKTSFVESSMEWELEDRLKRLQDEMQKCILCFSCRQACYGCYCKTCFIERDVPNWLPQDLDISTKMMFHLGRAMHLAGRCVECGACERVCPSGVKIRYLIQELTDLCHEQYGYRAGMDMNETPAMATFSLGDREIGFLGGDQNES